MPQLNMRELATVLAALRLWQERTKESVCNEYAPVSEDFMDVATDGGIVSPLSETEIDSLCERLNQG